MRAEVGLYFEQLTKVVVEGVQQVVAVGVADQDHPAFQGNRLRFQRRGRDKAGILDHLFDPNLLGAESVLESDPRQWLTQDRIGLEDEITAVRAVDGARRDLIEVSQHGAELHSVLDAADQVMIGGALFVNDGRACVRIVVHEHIHPVVGERVFSVRCRPLGGLGTAALVLRVRELLCVLYDLLAQPLQVLDHFRNLAPVRL